MLLQNKWEAEAFYQKLTGRFDKFGLDLALQKRKILEFERFAKQNGTNRGLVKPKTFDFLRFAFYCSENGKKEFFRCNVKTMKEWIKIG